MTANSAAVVNPADAPVSAKLEALLNLQRIDSQLDEIRRVRGTCPKKCATSKTRLPATKPA